MAIDYDKLQKLWKQLGIENNIKWQDVEGNIWEDFQLGRTPIYFNGKYDNSSEGSLYPKPTNINFITQINPTVTGKFYYELLKCCYPWYYDNDPFIETWLKTLEKLFNRLDVNSTIVLNNSFIMLTSSNIEVWEKEYGVPTNQELDLSYRKKRLLAKMFTNQPFFKKNIKQLGVILNNEELDYNTIPDDFFIGYRIPDSLLNDSEYISKLLDTWQPAHLNGGVGISKVVWQTLEPYNWNEVSNFKWYWY